MVRRAEKVDSVEAFIRSEHKDWQRNAIYYPRS